MANLVEYIISLKDKFSSPMASAQRQVQSFNKSVNSVNRTTSKASSGIGGLGFAVGGLGTMFTAAAIGAGALAFQVGKMGMDMEQTRVRFETFLGSAEKGNELIAKYQKFALDTPFDDKQVITAGQSLLAFGVQAKDTIPVMSKIGNISSAVGKDFNDLTTIYGKAKIAGTLYAEDINQLIEAGIPIIDEFSKQLGVPPSKIKKMASDGKISFKMLDKAFDNLGGATGKWGNLMEKQSKTFGGRLSSLKGMVQNLGSSLGEMALPFMGSIVDSGTKLVTFINTNKAALGSMFTPLMEAFQPFTGAFNSIIAQMGLAGDGGSFLKTVFNGIATAIKIVSPFVSILAKHIGFVALKTFQVIKSFKDWYERTAWVQKGVKVLYLQFKYAFEDIATMASKIFGGIADIISGVFDADLSKITKGVKGIGDGLYKSDKEQKEQQRRFDKDMKESIAVDLFGNKKGAVAAAKSGANNLITNNGGGNGGGNGKPDADTNSKLAAAIGSASGSKSNVYNINIHKLVESIENHFTNVSESKEVIKNIVLQALTGAVSDLTTNIN